MCARRVFLVVIAIATSPILLAGCVSPIALHQAVLEYDRSVSRVESELLLLNIARSRYNRPIHFTAVSSIAATFDFQVNTGITGALVENPGRETLTLALGSSASENPTLNIVPVQGKEFTKRLLTPLDNGKLYFLMHQGRIEPAIILRLMARGISLDGYGESRFILNMPHRKEEYKEFRRRILHLSALELERQLYVGPIRFTEDSSQVFGRIAITNYDPMSMSNEERKRLHEELEMHPPNFVYVDIRPGDYPGGEYPLKGLIKLRSFKAILGFLGRGIDVDPEFHVEKDPRTGPVLQNPPRTVNIMVSRDYPKDAAFSINYNGQWYWIHDASVRDGKLQSWDSVAFDVLYQLYQMTVTDVSRVPAPAITIAK